MLRNGMETRHTRKPIQTWRCAIERRERARAHYQNLQGVAYNWRLLQMRRATALHARRQREAA
jgi:hypothetical protein